VRAVGLKYWHVEMSAIACSATAFCSQSYTHIAANKKGLYLPGQSWCWRHWSCHSRDDVTWSRVDDTWLWVCDSGAQSETSTAAHMLIYNFKIL